MKRSKLVQALAILCFLWLPTPAMADAKNTFSAGFFLGDSYGPSNLRLSIKSFDIGYSDMASLYAGSRAWLGNYYAGFGLGVRGAVYGLVGYEWRFISWLGLSGEFDGLMSADGQSAGRVYIGLVAGW